MLHNNYVSDKYIEPVISDKTNTNMGDNVVVDTSKQSLNTNPQNNPSNINNNTNPQNNPIINTHLNAIDKPLVDKPLVVNPQNINSIDNSLVVEPQNINPIDKPLVINPLKNSIIVEIERLSGKITFYDNLKKYIGSFTINEFFKYMTNPLIETEYKITIEKYICNVSIDKTINMLNCEQSTVMGNIGILLKFYVLINDFENNDLHKMLKLYPETEDIFNEIHYALLLHILKTISMVLNKMTSLNYQKIRNKLLTHSTAIVYKLTKLNKMMIDKKINEINTLNENKEKNTSLNDLLDLQDKKFNKKDYSFSDLMMN